MTAPKKEAEHRTKLWIKGDRAYWVEPCNIGKVLPVIEIREGETICPAGSVCVSREELIQAFGQAYCSTENAKKVLDAEVGIELARILFGKEAP